MGESTFLFRNPTSIEEEHLPIAKDGLEKLWYKTLKRLEAQLKKMAFRYIRLDMQLPYKKFLMEGCFYKDCCFWVVE